MLPFHESKLIINKQHFRRFPGRFRRLGIHVRASTELYDCIPWHWDNRKWEAHVLDILDKFWKSLLSYHSAHSKLVKRSVAYNSWTQCVKKWSYHEVERSINRQGERLKNSGHPDAIIASVAEKTCRSCLITKEACKKRIQACDWCARHSLLPNLSRALKKVANISMTFTWCLQHREN